MRWLFAVLHYRGDAHDTDIFKKHVEILHFLARVVDLVPFDLCAFKGLTGAYRLVEIRAGAIKLFSMTSGACTRVPVILPVLLSVGTKRP